MVYIILFVSYLPHYNPSLALVLCIPTNGPLSTSMGYMFAFQCMNVHMYV